MLWYHLELHNLARVRREVYVICYCLWGRICVGELEEKWWAQTISLVRNTTKKCENQVVLGQHYYKTTLHPFPLLERKKRKMKPPTHVIIRKVKIRPKGYCRIKSAGVVDEETGDQTNHHNETTPTVAQKQDEEAKLSSCGTACRPCWVALMVLFVIIALIRIQELEFGNFLTLLCEEEEAEYGNTTTVTTDRDSEFGDDNDRTSFHRHPLHDGESSQHGTVEQSFNTTVTPSNWWPNLQWIDSCVTGMMMPSPSNNLTSFRIPKDINDVKWVSCIERCTDCPNPMNVTQSILSEYSFSVCTNREGQPGNLTVFDELLDRRSDLSGYNAPDPNTLVVYLPYNSEIEQSNSTVWQILQQGMASIINTNNNTGGTNVKSVYEMLEAIQTSRTRNITMTGSIFGVHSTQNAVYASCLEQAVEHAGYAVDIRQFRIPDERHFFLGHARRIMILGNDAYSRFMASAVQRHGGIVVKSP